MKGTGLRSPRGGASTLLPKVVGIDPSLRSTGIACSLGWADQIVPPTPLSGIARMNYITTRIRAVCPAAALVVIEGPSYGSFGRGQHERAGLWWLIRWRLRRMPIAICPPAVLKKYATGHGNASKDQVLAKVIRTFPGFDVTGNDQADAVILCALGAHHLGHPLTKTSAIHDQVLGSVEWPMLKEAA